MQYAIFETFQVMFGRKSSLSELIDLLRLFSRKSVLHTCAVIGVLTRLWERKPDLCHYNGLLSMFFNPILADCYRWSSRQNPPAYVFHRRQLLFLMKLAISVCPEQGKDVGNEGLGIFGLILLMVNDHFYYGLYREKKLETSRDNLARLVAEFVPITEYTGFEITNRIVRSHLLLTVHVERCSNHPDFIDIPDIFEQCTGLSLIEYQGLCFLLFSKWSTITLDQIRANPASMWLATHQFKNVAISTERIEIALAEFVGNVKNLSIQFSNINLGANNFSAFKEKPLLMDVPLTVPADLLFLVEKFQAGPYWKINGISTSTGDKLRRFWGAVFESYCDDLLTRSFEGASRSLFIPDPRDSSDSNIQVCDGLIVEGDSLIILEYKSNMFSAQSKYSGDYLALQKEIENKYVHSEHNRKKGIEQLADTINALFRPVPSMSVNELDLSGIRRVYPVLITLDEIGGCLLMSALLNTYFDNLISRNGFVVEICPVFCFHIETLELFAGSLREEQFSDFLRHWLKNDPLMRGTFPAFLKSTARPSSFLQTEWNKLYDTIGYLLFPNEFSAEGAKQPSPGAVSSGENVKEKLGSVGGAMRPSAAI
jgi:hypothetical protein